MLPQNQKQLWNIYLEKDSFKSSRIFSNYNPIHVVAKSPLAYEVLIRILNMLLFVTFIKSTFGKPNIKITKEINYHYS